MTGLQKVKNTTTETLWQNIEAVKVMVQGRLSGSVSNRDLHPKIELCINLSKLKCFL